MTWILKVIFKLTIFIKWFEDFSLLRDAPVNAAEVGCYSSQICIHFQFKSTISGSLLDATSSGAQNGESATKPHFLTLAYYQRFFDVEEEQVNKHYIF